MKRRCVIENAVGELRAAIYEGSRLVELYVRRWSKETLSHVGDVFAARVKEIDKTLNAAFVELGQGEAGFLRFSNASHIPHLHEGQMIDVEILREAEMDKGPIVRFLNPSKKTKPERLKVVSFQEFIEARFPDIIFEEASVSAIDEAVLRHLSIPGGGELTVEPTRALIAIDVDKGRARQNLGVCLAASQLIAQQLRLRGLGGLIVIDYPNLSRPAQRTQVEEGLREAFSTDPATLKFAPMSRFGAIEMTRSQSSPSLDKCLYTSQGEPTVETQALRALRQLERAGRSSPGARLILEVTPDLYSWLEQTDVEWNNALKYRLGARFEIQVGSKTQIKADR